MAELFNTCTAEMIQPGAKFYWQYQHPGGYRWLSLVKCEVLRRLPSGRIKIRVWRAVRGEWQATERSVQPDKLLYRTNGAPTWTEL